MLQPSTLAKELTAWMHVPSQPFDAITAFAVPDPNGSSQNPSVFSGPGVQRITSSDGITQLISDQLRLIEANPFSHRCECDFGYALTANSCEGVNRVDACTATALDAITAFAVPDPNGSSQSPSVFSGPSVQ